MIIATGEYGPGEECEGLLEFIAGMGYLLYDDPTENGAVVVSDHPVTYREMKQKFTGKNDWIDLEWWNNDTDFNDRLSDELDEYTF